MAFHFAPWLLSVRGLSTCQAERPLRLTHKVGAVAYRETHEQRTALLHAPPPHHTYNRKLLLSTRHHLLRPFFVFFFCGSSHTGGDREVHTSCSITSTRRVSWLRHCICAHTRTRRLFRRRPRYGRGSSLFVGALRLRRCCLLQYRLRIQLFFCSFLLTLFSNDVRLTILSRGLFHVSLTQISARM